MFASFGNMDSSKDATIVSSSTIGCTVALLVLSCSSISQLRRRIHLFLVLPSHCKPREEEQVEATLPLKTPEILLTATDLVVILVKRFAGARRRASKPVQRRDFWLDMMKTDDTYKDWSRAAEMAELEKPEEDLSEFYDEELVRSKLHDLRQRRKEGRDLRDIMFCMRSDLLRNLGNMCNPRIRKSRFQMSKLIKEYIDEISKQLKMVCFSDSGDQLLLEERLSFMKETRHAFGRTALLLSGGASLGAFHVGVVKTLVEAKLLPQIIAGSSVGSIVSSVIATRSRSELESFLENSLHTLQFFDRLGGAVAVCRRIIAKGVVHEITQLQGLLRDLTSNMTFQEAYDNTGIVLCVTVCSPRRHEPPRCLSYLTSRHVVIWSAVSASCAFPGLFEPQELMAKNRSGELVPFHPPFQSGGAADAPARLWRDGTLQNDLPILQMKELFGANQFIVSQANPHITPLLRLKEYVRASGGNFAARLAHLVEMEVKHRFNQMLELGFPLKGIAKLFAQDWEGDITIVMPATLAQYSRMIQNPSLEELQTASDQGRRCTWEKLAVIKANSAIELVLDECVANLNNTLRIKRSAKRAAAAFQRSASTFSSLVA